MAATPVETFYILFNGNDIYDVQVGCKSDIKDWDYHIVIKVPKNKFIKRNICLGEVTIK